MGGPCPRCGVPSTELAGHHEPGAGVGNFAAAQKDDVQANGRCPDCKNGTSDVAAPSNKSSAGKESDDNRSPSVNEPWRKRMAAEYRAIKPFVIISTTYLLFTVTDGGVRTIVLFNAFQRAFTAFEVAVMFTLYELAGVFTNFLAGIAGARWGIKSTLLAGLALQVCGIGMLYGWSTNFTKTQAIIFVTIAQALSGVSKDLVKLGGKAVTKLVTPESKQGTLFKRVSMITGLKNSLKGVGYFLGGALLQWSYYGALSVMIVIVLAAVPWAALSLDSGLGRTRRENINWRSIFKKNHNINVLSSARFFLFASRDAWFDVPLPFFLRSQNGLGWERAPAAAVLGAWIVLYGQMQSWTPLLVSKPLRQYPANKYHSLLWILINFPIPVVFGCLVQFTDIFERRHLAGMIAIVMTGIFAFAIVFAINSSIHSYLIVKYSEGDKVAMNIGFYYMSNSAGRLFGTLVGGALYEFVGSVTDGFAACFWFSCCLTLVAAAITPFLHDSDGGFACGPCLTCIKVHEKHDDDAPLSGDTP